MPETQKDRRKDGQKDRQTNRYSERQTHTSGNEKNGKRIKRGLRRKDAMNGRMKATESSFRKQL